MKWHYYFVLLVAAFVGYVAAKQFPSVFSGIPVVNKLTG